MLLLSAMRRLLGSLGSANTCLPYAGWSLDEVTERIREAIELCLEVEGAPEHDLEFVGIQRVTIAA